MEGGATAIDSYLSDIVSQEKKKASLKRMKIFKKAFLSKIQRVFLVLAGLAFEMTLISHPVRADISESPSKDLTEFFKQAINNPPDLEHFRASQRTLKVVEFPPELAAQIKKREEQLPKSGGPPIFFEGSRAGSNFIMRRYTADSSGQPDWNANVVALGRRKDVLFRLSGKSVDYVLPDTTNTINDSIKMETFVISQLLNMGISNIKIGSVIWHGSQFNAINSRGGRLRGELALSNNIPSGLKLFENDDVEPYMKFAYFYPNDANSLSGFPNKIINSDLNNGSLIPSVEINILEIKLARAPLSDEYFNEIKFAKAEIRQTNYYSNNVVFAHLQNGTVIKLKPPAKKHADKHDKTIQSSLFFYVALTVILTAAVLAGIGLANRK